MRSLCKDLIISRRDSLTRIDISVNKQIHQVRTLKSTLIATDNLNLDFLNFKVSNKKVFQAVFT